MFVTWRVVCSSRWPPCLARYHRRGEPDISDYKSILNKGDDELLIRLAAVLRLAEFLERGRNAAVDDIIVTWDHDELRLTLVADLFPAVELWEAQRNAVPLVEAAFKRQVHLDSVAVPSKWGRPD